MNIGYGGYQYNLGKHFHRVESKEDYFGMVRHGVTASDISGIVEEGSTPLEGVRFKNWYIKQLRSNELNEAMQIVFGEQQMTARRSFLEMLVGSAIAIPFRARTETNPFVSIERYIHSSSENCSRNC